jgi:hypothetical protein
MVDPFPVINSGSSSTKQKSATPQHPSTDDRRLGNPTYVSEYVDEYYKQRENSFHEIFGKRSGRKPEWLAKIENVPVPADTRNEALFKSRNASVFKEDFRVRSD